MTVSPPGASFRTVHRVRLLGCDNADPNKFASRFGFMGEQNLERLRVRRRPPAGDAARASHGNNNVSSALLPVAHEPFAQVGGGVLLRIGLRLGCCFEW
jgi:hypothetical protein